MDLINEKAETNDVERAHLLNGYVQYVRDISSHRQAQYSHFMSIHLFLLPAHAALITRPDFTVFYSAMVALLGMTFCYISYQRISGNFRHMEIGYEVLHEIERDHYPYRFYTVVGERLAEKERRKRRFSIRPRRAELVFHWIIAGMYLCLPIIHYNLIHLRRIIQ